MALSKEYLVYDTRRKYPFLENASDEEVYRYGARQYNDVEIEPWDINDTKQQTQFKQQSQLNELVKYSKNNKGSEVNLDDEGKKD